jgi:hypothetical protein
MSLSGANAGYLDVRNAILRVGTLDVQTIVSGVDTATNIAKTNTILLWDDQGSDMNSPPFVLSSATRSTSPPYLDLGGGFAYAGIKLPNAWLGAFEVYMSDKTDGSIKLHTYTTDTTTYGDTGYELVLDNSGVTLNYDGTQVATAAYTWTNDTWHQVVVGFERGAWTVSVDGTVVIVEDDDEREAVYANVGQYLRLDAADASTTKRVRYVKFAANGHWLQNNAGVLSYSQGKVAIGTHNESSYLLTIDSGSSYKTLKMTSNVEPVGPHLELVDSFSNGMTISYMCHDGTNVKRNNSVEFRGRTSNPINFHFTPSDNLDNPEVVIDTSGRLGVGIGTAPSHLLDVGGNANVLSLYANYVEGSGYVDRKTYTFNPDTNTDLYYLFGSENGARVHVRIYAAGWGHIDSDEFEISSRWGETPVITKWTRGYDNEIKLYYTYDNNYFFVWFKEISGSNDNDITYTIDIMSNVRINLSEPTASGTYGKDNAVLIPSTQYKLHQTYQGSVGIGVTVPYQDFHSNVTTNLFTGRVGVGNVLSSGQEGTTQDMWNLGTKAQLVIRKDQGITPDATYANARTYSFLAFVPQFDAQDTTNMGLWGTGAGENPKFYIQTQINNGQNGASSIALQPVSGNVGIGTSGPGSLLEVGSGAATSNGAEYITVRGRRANAAGEISGIKFKNSNDSGGRLASIVASRGGDNHGTQLEFKTTANSGDADSETTRLRISSGGTAVFSGNIEMGNRLLGSHGSGDVFWLGLQGTGTEYQRLAFGIQGDITTGLVDNVTFQVGGLERARINSSGWVGISTTTPGEKLDVANGDAWIRGYTGNHFAILSVGQKETNPTFGYYNAIRTRGTYINLTSPYSGTYYGQGLIVGPDNVTGATMWGNSSLQIIGGTMIVSGGNVAATGNNGSGLAKYYGGDLYLDGGVSYVGSGGSDSATTYHGAIYFRTIDVL